MTQKQLKERKTSLNRRVREITQFTTEEALKAEFLRCFPMMPNVDQMNFQQLNRTLILDAIERTFPE